MIFILRYLHNLLLVKRLWYSYHYIPCKKKSFTLFTISFIDQDVNSRELYCQYYVALVFHLT